MINLNHYDYIVINGNTYFIGSRISVPNKTIITLSQLNEILSLKLQEFQLLNNKNIQKTSCDTCWKFSEDFMCEINKFIKTDAFAQRVKEIVGSGSGGGIDKLNIQLPIEGSILGSTLNLNLNSEFKNKVDDFDSSKFVTKEYVKEKLKDKAPLKDLESIQKAINYNGQLKQAFLQAKDLDSSSIGLKNLLEYFDNLFNNRTNADISSIAYCSNDSINFEQNTSKLNFSNSIMTCLTGEIFFNNKKWFIDSDHSYDNVLLIKFFKYENNLPIGYIVTSNNNNIYFDDIIAGFLDEKIRFDIYSAKFTSYGQIKDYPNESKFLLENKKNE